MLPVVGSELVSCSSILPLISRVEYSSENMNKTLFMEIQRRQPCCGFSAERDSDPGGKCHTNAILNSFFMFKRLCYLVKHQKHWDGRMDPQFG